MGWRERTIIGSTAASGPLGAVLLGVLLGRLADATEGGMAGLAGVVGGLFLGPVVVPLVVFVVLLVTPLGAGVARRGRAMLGMVGVAVAVGALTMLLLVVVARTEAGGAVVALAAALLLAALGAGAYAALRLGRAPGGGAVTAAPSP